MERDEFEVCPHRGKLIRYGAVVVKTKEGSHDLFGSSGLSGEMKKC